ncbi:TVP38/TMEM64 family protein [Maricaulis sp. D1M11]|uniref:TVP38/TMEM64 family protein n=1 Tax=Maricaulis sp. D1M11 TaxID=3076117 RepID=UPI0039B68644
MRNLFQTIVDFVLRMDAKAARAVMVSLMLFGMVAMVFVFGKFFMDSETGIFGIWFEEASTQWYALPLTILVFTLMSFLGAPQFALMAAAVLAFGPVTGFFYAWTGTLVAGSVNYTLGRYFGADILKRYGGDWANRISDFIGRNGLLASMIVRWVPSGPFIVVNMGFGVARTPYWAFILGLAIGAAPKIILVSLAGQSILDLLNGQNLLIVLGLAIGAGLWIGVMLLARRWLRRNRSEL